MNEIERSDVAIVGILGLILGMVIGSSSSMKNPTITEPKFKDYNIEWSHEFTNGTLLHRGIYEDENYLYEVSDTARDGVIASLKNMVNA